MSSLVSDFRIQQTAPHGPMIPSPFQLQARVYISHAALRPVCVCSCCRRLNNNSLSGPFPASLAKIPQLSFLYVRTRLVEAISASSILLHVHLLAASFPFCALNRIQSVNSMRLVGVCSQGPVLQQPHWPRPALPDTDLQVSALNTAAAPPHDRLILMHTVTFASSSSFFF